MMLAHHRHHLAGGDESTQLGDLKTKYGNGMVKGPEELNDVMGLVAPYFKQDSWQFCTIASWLNGTPSEDDVDWKAEYFSEMPLLEETCGDHTTFGSQYDEAFDDLKSAGCSQDVINWIRTKGQANFDIKRKGKIAEQEGSKRWEAAKSDAGAAINPLSPKSPLFWGLLAAVALLVLVKRPPASRVVVQGETP